MFQKDCNFDKKGNNNRFLSVLDQDHNNNTERGIKPLRLCRITQKPGIEAYFINFVSLSSGKPQKSQTKLVTKHKQLGSS